MEKTTHYEETTKVVEHGPAHHVADTHVTDTKHKTKTKKNRKAKHNDQLGPKKSVGTKIKEFFTGRKDNGIVYQNGLPIAGLNGPIVQPMGAPIRQPAEIHPVATVNPTPNTGHVPGDHFMGPTTTTYGPAPPLAPGMPEGYTKTTTTTEVIHPGMQNMQPMNAIAQPTGLGAVVQPAGVIIAKKDKATMGLKDGYLKDRVVHDFPHDKIKDKPLKAERHAKDTHHVHEEIHTQTTEDFIAPPINAVPGEPAPVIFTGPARVLDEKHTHADKHAHKDKHAKHDKHDKHATHGANLYEQPYHTNIDTVMAKPNAYMQPTVLEQQPMPVTVMGPGAMAQPPLHQHQEMYIQERHHEAHIPAQPNMIPNTQQPGAILQQPGMAPSHQPIVRNHEQVPMVSQSGLAQGGIFQNETARPVQTFTPVVQQNMPLSQPPILDQAAREQATFAPAGIRTNEGLIETRAPATVTKHTAPTGYEERKETVVHKDVKY